MVTELYIPSDTVEPSTADDHARREPFDLRTHLESSAAGRFTLQCSRWLVVIALILTGYFAAGAISAGVDSISNHEHRSQRILAASHHK